MYLLEIFKGFFLIMPALSRRKPTLFSCLHFLAKAQSLSGFKSGNASKTTCNGWTPMLSMNAFSGSAKGILKLLTLTALKPKKFFVLW